MSEAYVECLIKAKTKGWMKALAGCLVAIAVLCVVGFFLSGRFLIFLVAAAAGAGAYFLTQYSEVEYEYLYLDKELTIDSISGKTSRKRVGTYSLDKIEILAPIKSYHLDNYKNRQVKVTDYSIGEELQPDLRYCFYYEGGEKVIISPNEELVKVMKNIAPRKIFND